MPEEEYGVMDQVKDFLVAKEMSRNPYKDGNPGIQKDISPYASKRIIIYEGDITRYQADAIVLPTNPLLDIEGFGCAGAILRAAGNDILDEAKTIANNYYGEDRESVDARYLRDDKDLELRKVPLGSAHLTTAGRLNAKNVIHAVCVVYSHSQPSIWTNKDIVSEATRNSLQKANEKNLNSIAFPLFGTGFGGMAPKESIGAMFDEFDKYYKAGTVLNEIALVLYGHELFELASEMMEQRDWSLDTSSTGEKSVTYIININGDVGGDLAVAGGQINKVSDSVVLDKKKTVND